MSATASRFVFRAFERALAKCAFTCGNDALDRYWRERAGQDSRRNVARVFTLFDTSSQAVAGYYTLAAASAMLTDLPPAIQEALPKYGHIPVVLLGRLAVASAYQGQGLGGTLVYDAAARVRRSGIGSYALVTDPFDEGARAFYLHLGFQLLEGEHGRLFAPIASLMT